MINNAAELTTFTSSRNYLVMAATYYIQHLCHSLNTIERITLAYLISKIGPKDTIERSYEIDLDELLVLLRWTDMRYTSIRKALHKLSEATWWFSGSSETHKGLIHYSTTTFCSRLVIIKFSAHLENYLFGLRAGSNTKPVTLYPLRYILPMTHRYSIRLYELMKSHANLETWVYDYGTGSNQDLLPVLLQWTEDKKLPPSGKRWDYFEAKILKPAVEEINTYTDLTISYTGYYSDQRGRRTNSIRCIEFKIIKKNTGDTQAIDNIIDKLYEDYAEKWKSRFAKAKSRPVYQIPKDDEKKAPSARSKPEKTVPQSIPHPCTSTLPCVCSDHNDDDDLFKGDADELIADPKETERAFKALEASIRMYDSDPLSKLPPAERPISRYGYSDFPTDQSDFALMDGDIDDLPF